MAEPDLTFMLRNWLTVILTAMWCLSVFTFGTVEIAEKVEFPSDCLDADNVVRAHLDEWTSASGSCDRMICYIGDKETTKWKISYSCPTNLEFLDTGNCQYVSNSTLTFPGCCPKLECGEGTPNTVTYAPCSDLSPTVNCVFWKAQTNCVDSANTDVSFLYNLTTSYCRKTCGFC